jgi:protein-disulfide isomerase
VLARGLAQGATHSALEVYMSQEVLGPFCAAPTPLAVPGAGRLGSPQAPIEVVEFADFRCTHCRQAMPMVHDAVQRLQGVVQLRYVPLSLVDHPHSTAAAEAVLAAGGQQKFWPMHAALFAREQGDYDMPVLEAAAKTAGLNLKQFRQDMRSHRYLKTLEDFKKQALAADITGTPAFFINGRRFMPTPGIFELTDRLDMERVRDQPTCQ